MALGVDATLQLARPPFQEAQRLGLLREQDLLGGYLDSRRRLSRLRTANERTHHVAPSRRDPFVDRLGALPNPEPKSPLDGGALVDDRDRPGQQRPACTAGNLPDASGAAAAEALGEGGQPAAADAGRTRDLARAELSGRVAPRHGERRSRLGRGRGGRLLAQVAERAVARAAGRRVVVARLGAVLAGAGDRRDDQGGRKSGDGDELLHGGTHCCRCGDSHAEMTAVHSRVVARSAL
jgi:hypothetical protein